MGVTWRAKCSTLCCCSHILHPQVLQLWSELKWHGFAHCECCGLAWGPRVHIMVAVVAVDEGTQNGARAELHSYCSSSLLDVHAPLYDCSHPHHNHRGHMHHGQCVLWGLCM